MQRPFSDETLGSQVLYVGIGNVVLNNATFVCAVMREKPVSNYSLYVV